MILLSVIGIAGASSYAVAQNTAFRYPLDGVKMSASNSIGDDTGQEETGQDPGNDISHPSDFVFSNNNEQLSGNTGGAGTVIIYDDLGNQLGQGNSDENGDFTISLPPSISNGDNLSVEITDGSDTLVSGVTVPGSDIVAPNGLTFNETGDQLSGNVGDSGTVTVYDDLGNQIGQTTSDSNGDFIVSIDPIPEAGTVLEVEVDSGSETLTSNITVPEIETDVACYDIANVGKIGTYQGCEDMLIVNRVMLDTAIDNGTYTIEHEGTTYTLGDNEHNVFTGQVTSMRYLFSSEKTFNEDIGYWDTSNVIDMSYMFRYATIFNQDIGGWDTSNVTEMSSMFAGMSDFNQPIGNWNTSNVTDMASMFSGNNAFNQYIGDWDTSNVTYMGNMFSYSVFNQDIGNWNVSSVENMTLMFEGSYFNQDIGRWEISQATHLGRMFYRASDFNQDLSDWCVGERPTVFDEEATSWILPKPEWGTCP